MIIKKIDNEEMAPALKLVWKVFLEFEAPDYTEEGIKEFKTTIENKQWIEERDFYGAFDNNNIVGVIATHNYNHISLFFVDGKYHRQGIGKELFSKVKELNKTNYFTVNSSPYAHEVYKNLGFIDTDDEQCINGLKFYPMKSEFK